MIDTIIIPGVHTIDEVLEFCGWLRGNVTLGLAKDAIIEKIKEKQKSIEIMHRIGVTNERGFHDFGDLTVTVKNIKIITNIK